MIAPIGGDSQTISMPTTKEVVADAACGGAWFNTTPGQVNWTVFNGITPGGTGLAIRFNPAPSKFLIGNPTIYPTCGISGSLHVG